MASEQYTVERMLETRVARRKELAAFPESFVDTVIPRYRRKLYSIIGKSVFEDPEMRPAITVQHPFSFSLIEVEPGHGAGLHSHTTEEVFMPVDGKLAVFWGDQGENEVELGPLDTITVPIGVMRGFRNAGKEEAYLMAVLGGTDAGRVVWSPKVMEQAKVTGLSLDKKGNLVTARR